MSIRIKINISTTVVDMEEDTAMPDAQSEIVSYPHLVLPGELLSTDSAQTLKLGPGLRHVTNTTWQTLIQATQAGLLHKTKRAEYYVDYNSRRVSLISRSLLKIVHPKSR